MTPPTTCGMCSTTTTRMGDKPVTCHLTLRMDNMGCQGQAGGLMRQRRETSGLMGPAHAVRGLRVAARLVNGSTHAQP